jgi:DNA-binding MarR family transcriptional regulator
VPVVGETLQFMQLLWNLSHVLEVRSKRMARTLGVTGPQRLVIRLLGQRASLSARQIAATLGIHPSTLSGVLRRLEGSGSISRSIDPADRRRALFVLTAKGKRIDSQRKGTVEAVVRRALARIDADDLATTARALQTLIEELSRDV